MRIGELARLTGISIRAIRHYDLLGLLEPVRDVNKYRSFTREDVERVKLIQLFLSIGFRLEEIRDHAPCWQKGSLSSSRTFRREEAKAFLQQKLTELDERTKALAFVRSRLQEQLDIFSVEDASNPGVVDATG